MKRIVFIIIVLLFPLLGCYNDESQNAKLVDFYVSSPIENQVQHVDDFRLDKIWLELVLEDGYEQIILTEDNISKKDIEKLNKPGKHSIEINIGSISKSISLFLYDDSLDERVFCVNYNDQTSIEVKESIYDVNIPSMENYYFAGWYTDETRLLEYSDTSNDKVVVIYPKFSDKQTYRLRYFHKNLLLKEEYVLEGDSGTPPIMKSYDDYSFSHWDKDFSNVLSDLDINAVYVKGYYEVRFYDNNNKIITTQLVKSNEAAIAPNVEKVEGYEFIGWNCDFSKINSSLDVYPIFVSSKNYYTVKFYFNNISDDTYLYEVTVEEGDSLDFKYNIDNYIFKELDKSLENISSDMSVICYFYPICNRFYIENELYIELPFYDTLPYVSNDSYWVLSDTEPNRYDLAYFDCGVKLNFDNQEIVVSTEEFLNYDPRFYVGITYKKYKILEWYLDSEYNTLLDDYSILYSEDMITLYGKNTEIEYDKSLMTITPYLVTIDGVTGWELFYESQDASQTKILYIPAYYGAYPIISVNYIGISYVEYAFISENLININYNPSIYHNHLNKGIFVKEDNPIFFSIDGFLYERAGDMNILIKVPNDREIDIMYIPEKTIIREMSFFGVSLDELHIGAGCEINVDIGTQYAREVYLTKDVYEKVDLNNISTTFWYLYVIDENETYMYEKKSLEIVYSYLLGYIVNNIIYIDYPNDEQFGYVDDGKVYNLNNQIVGYMDDNHIIVYNLEEIYDRLLFFNYFHISKSKYLEDHKWNDDYLLASIRE